MLTAFTLKTIAISFDVTWRDSTYILEMEKNVGTEVSVFEHNFSAGY